MRITDPDMLKKMERALGVTGSFTLDDIDKALAAGTMQSHVYGNTWVITQIYQFPRKLVVNILFAVGELDDTLEAAKEIENWARNMGAKALTFTGREGWQELKIPGWKKAGVIYSKDIDHGR